MPGYRKRRRANYFVAPMSLALFSGARYATSRQAQDAAHRIGMTIRGASRLPTLPIAHARAFRPLPLDEITDVHLLQALETWRRWAAGRPAPRWSEVILYDLPPVLLPMTSVMDVLDGGRDFRCRYWGSGLTPIFGRDETGRLLSEHPVPEGRDVRLAQFRAFLASVEPQAFLLEFLAQSDIRMDKLNLRLPVVDESGAMDKILTVCTVEFTDELLD